ncbi:hypothetical protein [Corynebacterium guangdongense]|uniref:Suppressor of fused protein (SUFU) n=1 Tax=Corynebacterium guangdongense TaxID=1783348 RepID=A0ABU1ZYE9_9CORY|nr:hypothetical protein [Corynebacterium guangdongense]MDR7329956.1 hypothetical protein [Corynebacterium guangdongense]WJZ18514.1 hypothetical protein CGUA_09800 [Corynebacterium guangdongense]
MTHPAFRGSESQANTQVNAYFDALGRSDAEFLDTTNEAVAHGAALFPSGANRFRAVRTPQSLILATEGLAGHGVELYLEIMHGHGWMYEQIKLNWQYRVLQEAAGAVNLLGGLPVENFPVVLPVAAVNAAPMQLYFQEGGAGGLALLAGMAVPGRPATTADGTVTMVALTPITPAEYRRVQDSGSAEAVAANRAEMGFHHVVVDSAEVTGMIDERLAQRPD